MSSSKPCLASMPLAFMMFQTSGLNTGSVRLDTLMTGFCCACAGGASARANTTANAAKTRRDMVIIASPVWFPADPKKYALNAQGRQLGGNPGLAAFAAVKVSLAVFRIVGRLR